eukprot:5580634-Amphidinium_carterae.2
MCLFGLLRKASGCEKSARSMYNSTGYAVLCCHTRLCRAAIALRGLETPDAAADLERRAQSGEEAAAEQCAAAARDFEVR